MSNSRSAMNRIITRGVARGTLGAAVLTAGGGDLGAQTPMSWGEFRGIEPVEADHRLTYGSGPEAWGQLYLPEGPGPHPVALVVHGGCWQSIADVDYVSRFSRFLAESGWAVWAPEFRRIDQPGAAWPAILEDVGFAADHLRAIADEFRLDLGRVVSFGHSSGGHLALWLAGRTNLPPDPESGYSLRGDAPLPLRGVVGLAAIADLEDFDRRSDRGCGDAIVSRLVPGEGEEYDARMRLTSPSYALPLGVPQLLVTGALDATVPTAHGEAWVRVATAAGDRAELLEVVGAGHFELVAPGNPHFESAWPDVQTFLDAVVGARAP